MRPPAARAARLTPEAVAGITLRLDASCDRVCNIPAPTDGLQSKFSLRQTVAMALAGVDTASLGAYSAENARDPALVACASGSRSICRTAGRRP